MSVTPYNSFTDTESAAGFLAEHLGKGFDYWLRFLKKDQKRAEKNRDIQIWGIDYGIVCYDLSDIYRFIARRNPTALGFRPHTFYEECVRGSTFLPSVRVQCRYDEDCRLVVRVDVDDFYGDPILSSKTARKLGQELIDAANYCDSHYLDFEKWVVVRKPEAPEASSLISMIKAKVDDLRAKEGL